jgi:hypothetical protein
MRIAVKEGTKAIDLWKIRIGHQMLNIPRNILGFASRRFVHGILHKC